jgi:hypothetical protein
MNELLDRAMFVAVAIGLGLGLAPRSDADPPRADTTRLAVQQLAYVAYPMWWAEHDRTCPAALAELEGYTMARTRIVAWGHRLVGRCHPSGGLYVGSPGPDGEIDTADDIWSAAPPSATRAVPAELSL